MKNEDNTAFLDKFHINSVENWEMELSERMIFTYILQVIKPQLSLEIGSRNGGSLSALSRLSQRVDVIDIDTTIPQRLSKFTNVNFHIGDSREVLPSLLAKYEKLGVWPEFIHVDGAHDLEGAYWDIHHILSIVPKREVIIMMHDSFNQDVRAAIKKLKLADYRNLSYANIDFISGVLHTKKENANELWGGFALFVLSPERQKAATLLAYQDLQYQLASNYVESLF
jgi:hypothetical protein